MRRKRVTKTHEERRRDFIGAARILFIANGYEQTSMQQIARAAEVAQGTFYLYFRSKPDVLHAIMQELLDEVTAIIAGVAERPGLTAMQKLRQAWAGVVARMEGETGLLQAVYLRGNVSLPVQLLSELSPKLQPVLVAIIQQGNAEGSMQVTHPAFGADLLWTSGYRYFEHVARARMTGAVAPLTDWHQAFWEFVSRGLGAACEA